MQHYWEITRERALATLPVWAMQPGFTCKELNRAAYARALEQLELKATEQADAEQLLARRRAERDALFAKLRAVVQRAPGIIEAFLPDDSPLHSQLDIVYAIEVNTGEERVLARACHLARLWRDFDASHPAEGRPLGIKLSLTETIHFAQFQTLMKSCDSAQEEVALQRNAVCRAKTALRAIERQLDRYNKRWYLAWTRTFPAGTPEGDAARALLPTGAETLEPTPLAIGALTVDADRRVQVSYVAGGENATTLELQYRLPEDPEFGYSTPVTRPRQLVGPFPVGSLVTFRTRVANSTPGAVLGEARSVLV